MFALLKGIVAGIVIALIIPLLIHRISGGTGGVLAVHHVGVLGYNLYWSWPLFIIATLFGAALFKMME